MLKSECQEDKSMQDMVMEELGQSMEEEKRLQNVLLKSLLPKDDADERDCILEVRAGEKYNWHYVLVCSIPLLLGCKL